jgi:hypothetical protein
MLSKSAVVATLLGTNQASKVSTNRSMMIIADLPDQYDGPALNDNILTEVKHVIPVEQSRRPSRHHHHKHNRNGYSLSQH